MLHPQAAHDTALRERLRQDFNGGETEPALPGPLATQVGGSHYQNFAIQPAEFIDRNNLPFLEGCIIKRMCRHESKNKLEDLRKAIHEIQLIAQIRYGVTL
jgi:hypothetical protein